MVEFNSKQDVADWAKTRSREELALFAGRAAARVLPLIETWDETAARQLDLICCRATLIALVRGMYTTPAISRAASTAADAAGAATRAADATAHESSAVTGMSDSSAAAAADVVNDAGSAAYVATDATETNAANLSVAPISRRLTSPSAVPSGPPTVSAATVDAKMLEDGARDAGVAFCPLWPGDRVPQDIAMRWHALQGRWRQAPDTWSFWLDWYEGLLEGRAPDWELWRDVALIEDAHWQAGPEAVAGEIDRVKRALSERRARELDPESITQQARRLLAQPVSSRFLATELAERIEDAISDFMRETGTNCLPDALMRLERLPPILRAIAESTQSDERLAELEEQIRALVGETAALSREVVDLRAELAAKPGKGLAAIFVEQSVKTTATVLTTGFWGAVAAGISHFTGVLDVGDVLERLSGFGSGVEKLTSVAEAESPKTGMDKPTT
ncbi:MAG: hypothetical protein HLUCCA08_16045 [Rhodobacteraceae bacterium HLUCCA08]|nr:MAG: hypothetical protein HLUCCA08_16045 [Rhodobacteraceae bacterium HLUCCA08]